MHCDNATATGIANSTVKKQRARSMEMKFFWVSDQVELNIFQVRWHPGQENLGDYQSKHHPAAHHIAVRPWYLHRENSPRLLPRAVKPSILRGCVETLPRGYTKGSPLPRVPNRQNANMMYLYDLSIWCIDTMDTSHWYNNPLMLSSCAGAGSAVKHLKSQIAKMCFTSLLPLRWYYQILYVLLIPMYALVKVDLKPSKIILGIPIYLCN